jgi:predicted transcriptional regulator
MNKRQRKKTQKQLGYVSIGAWVRPEIRDALEEMAQANERSKSREIVLAIEAHVARAAK